MGNSLTRNLGISCFFLIISLVIAPSIFCVQIVNADLGHPQLSISSVVTPNEIKRGTTGTLTVVVKETGGNDWAKDVTVTPVPPQGCILNPPSGYISKINYGDSSTFTYRITVPDTASLGSETGTVNLKYYETGTLNIGVFGPYALSDSFSFIIAKGTGTGYISSSPSNANIKIDGILKGVTPQTASDVLEGTHTISFSKSGYQDYSTTFVVYPGQTTTVSGVLTPIPTVQPSAAIKQASVQSASKSNEPGASAPTSSGSSDSSGFVFLLMIGIVIIAGGYIGYSKIIKPKEKIHPSQPPAFTHQKENGTKPIPIISRNRTEQTILNQIADIRNNPAISPSTKSELNALQNTIRGINLAEKKHPLKEYARKQLDLINNGLDRIHRKGGIFSRTPDIIKQMINTENYVEAIIESDKFLSNLALVEEIFDKATVYRNAMPDPAIISPYNEGQYAVVIKVYEERRAKIDKINKLRVKIKQLNEDAKNVGSIPDSITKNFQAQDIRILEKTINDLESFIASAKPELTVSLDRTQLSAERWHKLGITLTNTGLSDVENVTFSFSSEFETKGIKPFSVKAGQSARADISIIPKNVGNILLEITLTYKDSKGREYLTVQEFWIDVVEKGTTTTPPFETPSSPFGQFTPRPLTQKQLPPDLSDRYSESVLIGQGGFARVFKAKRKDGKYVAIKIPIALDSATGKSFVAEIQNWTKLNHSNIVKIYDFNIMPLPYFEMELCDASLAEMKKPIESEEAAWILFNVCEGLKFTHSQKIIHRDLKPQNILVKDGTPKISDWGLSRVITESSASTAISFTPYYAAPEQINNRPKDERTDIWQLGVILYELVTGILPFKGESMIEIAMNIATKDPIPPGEIKPEAKAFDAVVMKCLQKDPARRYQSVLEMQKDLALYLRENYAELLKTSVSVQDYNRSAFYCGDLVMINLLTGDIPTAYKYLIDIVNYSKGDVKLEAQELSAQIKMRMEMGVTEIPDELIQKAERIVHKVSVGFGNRG